MKRLILHPMILLITLLLACLLLVGCATAASGGVYSEADSGKTVTVNSGETFTVKLAENPTTGYSWNMTVDKGLDQLGDQYIRNEVPAGIVGSGGYHEWTVKAVSPGTYMISGIYKRPWEPLAGDEQRFTLTVKVLENPTTSTISDSSTITPMKGFSDLKPGKLPIVSKIRDLFKRLSQSIPLRHR